MDNDKILDYVMNSPANTNPNVLKTMLNSGGSGGGGTADNIMVVGVTNIENGMQLNKTWKEIYDAMDSQALVAVHEISPAEDPATTLHKVSRQYVTGVIDRGPNWSSGLASLPGRYIVIIGNDFYYAETLNDYPAFHRQSEGGTV